MCQGKRSSTESQWERASSVEPTRSRSDDVTGLENAISHVFRFHDVAPSAKVQSVKNYQKQNKKLLADAGWPSSIICLRNRRTVTRWTSNTFAKKCFELNSEYAIFRPYLKWSSVVVPPPLPPLPRKHSRTRKCLIFFAPRYRRRFLSPESLSSKLFIRISFSLLPIGVATSLTIFPRDT